MKRVKLILSAVINLSVFIGAFFCVLSFFTTGGKGNMTVVGFRAFRYYTVDSNVLCGLSCLILAVAEIVALVKKSEIVPKWCVILKFIGSHVVMVTFLTVIVFLGPTYGFGMMYTGSSLYMHLILPVAAFASLMILERGHKLTIPESMLSLIPTAVYAVLYAVMTVSLREWEDFYGFNRTGTWYLTYLIMTAAIVALVIVSRLLYQFGKKERS